MTAQSSSVYIALQLAELRVSRQVRRAQDRQEAHLCHLRSIRGQAIDRRSQDFRGEGL
jgi:ribosome-associated translation inhibitor RaiA